MMPVGFLASSSSSGGRLQQEPQQPPCESPVSPIPEYDALTQVRGALDGRAKNNAIIRTHEAVHLERLNT